MPTARSRFQVRLRTFVGRSFDCKPFSEYKVLLLSLLAGLTGYFVYGIQHSKLNKKQTAVDRSPSTVSNETQLRSHIWDISHSRKDTADLHGAPFAPKTASGIAHLHMYIIPSLFATSRLTRGRGRRRPCRVVETIASKSCYWVSCVATSLHVFRLCNDEGGSRTQTDLSCSSNFCTHVCDCLCFPILLESFRVPLLTSFKEKS